MSWKSLWIAVFFVAATCSVRADDPQKPQAKKADQARRVVGTRPAGVSPLRDRAAKAITRDDETQPESSDSQITFDQLYEMLDNMGYEPKRQSGESSEWVDIATERGTWTFGITLSLSGDKSIVWMEAYLRKIENADKVSAAGPFGLLEANGAIWPAYFTYYTQNQTLWIQRPLENSNIKPASLRKSLNTFMNDIENSGPKWDVEQWPTTASE